MEQMMDDFTKNGILYVILACIALSTLARNVKELFFNKKDRDPEKEYVTRKELEQEIRTLKTDLVTKIENSQTATQKQVGDLTTYQHSAHHNTNNSIQTLAVKIERLLTLEEIRGNKRRPQQKPSDTN